MTDSANIIVPGLFTRGNGKITAGLSTRVGGVSAVPFGMNLSYKVGDIAASVRANRSVFFSALGGGETTTAFAAQCHSEVIRRVEKGGISPDCDALATSVPGLGLAISVADCVPVLIASIDGTCISAVHAGWRGTAKGILSKSLQFLNSEWNIAPSDVLVWIGPSAGPCCYEVGDDVACEFPTSTTRRDGRRVFVDLKNANAQQAWAQGIPEENVQVDERCTICGAGLFHSYRRDGAGSGRMLAYIRKDV